MTITTLPPSPSGEIDHNTVREKINETINVVNDPFDSTTNMIIERELEAVSLAATQNPTGLGIANTITAEFGAAQGDGLSSVMIDVAGKVTFNEAGLRRVTSFLQFGRSGASGTSDLYFRYLINGSQLGRSINQHLSNANDLGYFEITNWFNVPAGAELQLQVFRNLGSSDSGGLISESPTDEGAGTWNDSPCAVIRIERFVNTT